MADRLHLSPHDRSILEGLLLEHLPDVEAWAYGSRVNGRSHDGSDLDLALRAPGLTKIPAQQLAAFKDAVGGATIPFNVEAQDWARLPERFQRQIEREHVSLADGQAVPVATLGDYFDLQRGTTYRSRLLGQEGPVLLGLASIHRNGGFRSDSLRKYRGECPDKLIVNPGELYVSLKDVTQSADLLGAVARLPAHHTPGRLTQDTAKLKPKSDNVRLDYVYWLLRTPDYRHYCRAHATGTTNLGLPRDDFLAYPVPSLTSHRCHIVNTLSALEDKIELNRRMNQTLEAMARALFHSWFVDFEPVRAKMEGRDAGLPTSVVSLFPDVLDNRRIPEGWSLGRLAQIADSPRRGIDPSDVAEDTPYIGLEHMPRRSIALADWEGAGKVKSTKSTFNRGDILFGKLRPYFHKVGIASLDGICSTDIVVVCPRSPEWAAFCLACISTDEFVDYTDQTSTGTKMPRTSWKTMRQYETCLPPTQVAREFQRLLQPVIDRLNINVHESRSLARTRDVLLPKLISGELRVGDIERAVEAITMSDS